MYLLYLFIYIYQLDPELEELVRLKDSKIATLQGCAVYIHIHIHMCVCVCVCMYIHTYTYTCVCVCIERER